MASTYRLKLADQEHELEVEEHDGSFRVRLGDDWYPLELERVGETARYSLLLDHKPYDVFAEENPRGYHILIGARLYAVTTPGAGRGRRAGGPADVEAETEGGEWVLTSPMSGVVLEILVQPGDEVEAGQVVITIEAMKMQNDLHARRGGTVKAVYVSVGQRVDQGTPLLVVL
ncbi:MAG: biotin/lipoyl-binding protein [Chloroflexi bacterium]|nr:biotin/lipoyl-binding protein [Chloroflexota bacterium]